jgi:hypothetical protein
MSRFERFRRGLRSDAQRAFDRVWEHAHRHASAASYMNTSKPGMAAVLSMMVGMQREIQQLEQRIEELEDQ